MLAMTSMTVHARLSPRGERWREMLNQFLFLQDKFWDMVYFIVTCHSDTKLTFPLRHEMTHVKGLKFLIWLPCYVKSAAGKILNLKGLWNNFQSLFLPLWSLSNWSFWSFLFVTVTGLACKMSPTCYNWFIKSQFIILLFHQIWSQVRDKSEFPPVA